jgi:hypothetical protein
VEVVVELGSMVAEVEQVDFELVHHFSVCGATPYPITVGAGGAGATSSTSAAGGDPELNQYFQQLHQCRWRRWWKFWTTTLQDKDYQVDQVEEMALVLLPEK